MALEPWEREAGLWRPPLALGRLLAAGLGSAVLRAGALLTDFLGTSVGGRSRALEAARGSPTSAPAPRDRREMAGDGEPAVGPEESEDKAEASSTVPGWSLSLPRSPTLPHVTYLSVPLHSGHSFWELLGFFLCSQVPQLEAGAPSAQEGLAWAQGWVLCSGQRHPFLV